MPCIREYCLSPPLGKTNLSAKCMRIHVIERKIYIWRKKHTQNLQCEFKSSAVTERQNVWCACIGVCVSLMAIVCVGLGCVLMLMNLKRNTPEWDNYTALPFRIPSNWPRFFSISHAWHFIAIFISSFRFVVLHVTHSFRFTPAATHNLASGHTDVIVYYASPFDSSQYFKCIPVVNVNFSTTTWTHL